MKTLTLLALLAAASCGAQTSNGISSFRMEEPICIVQGRIITLREYWGEEAVKNIWKLTYTTNLEVSANYQNSSELDEDKELLNTATHGYWEVTINSDKPTERIWKTNTVEHLAVTLRVNGEDRTLTQERVVSSRSYTERLESKWAAKEQINFSPSFTNSVRPETKALRILESPK